MLDPASPRLKRVVYRAEHRGTKEMDVLLGTYARANMLAWGEAEIAEFERLVELPDPVVQGWIFEPESLGASEFGALVGKLRTFHGLAARKKTSDPQKRE